MERSAWLLPWQRKPAGSTHERDREKAATSILETEDGGTRKGGDAHGGSSHGPLSERRWEGIAIESNRIWTIIRYVQGEETVVTHTPFLKPSASKDPPSLREDETSSPGGRLQRREEERLGET